MLAIRAYVFTIYTVPVNVDNHIRKGDRIGVLHWLCSDIERGDAVVFGDSVRLIGIVKAVPGDSVMVDGEKYIIPLQCCNRCKSTDCHTFLLDVDTFEMLVQKHDMLGKAWRLY